MKMLDLEDMELDTVGITMVLEDTTVRVGCHDSGDVINCFITEDQIDKMLLWLTEARKEIQEFYKNKTFSSFDK